jgi:hypothetical protein
MGATQHYTTGPLSVSIAVLTVALFHVVLACHFGLNSFFLGLGLYCNPNPIPKGFRPCIYWASDWNKPQYLLPGIGIGSLYVISVL